MNSNNTDTHTECKHGYHTRKISKGVVGEISKIREELEELEDADLQDNKIMSLIELSDMIGAVEIYLERKHPSIKIEDLLVMARTTRRAFEVGERK